MKLIDLALMATAALAGSDIATQVAPSSLDVGGFPVRKYAGGALGAFAAGYFGGHKVGAVAAAATGAAAVFAAGYGGMLPSQIDVGGLPVRRYGAAAAAIWAANEFGLIKAVAKAV